MKLGLMGGTFDPIHLGHLRAAENAREALGLARVLFVPAARPPHRPGPIASALDRFAMTALATSDHRPFEASDVEILRTGPSYTIDTIDEFQAKQSRSLCLIVGSDTFVEMTGWKDAARIFASCEVAVVPRPGDTRSAPVPPFADAQRVSLVPGPTLDISATAVRACVREGRSVRYLVPSGVADYMAKRGLYS
jgi:nicotinate-nucleotide adenylyltransferase